MHRSHLSLKTWFTRHPHPHQPFQRHLRPAAAGAAGAGQLQDGLAAAAQAAPGHGRSRPQPAPGRGRDRRDRDALPLEARPRRPPQGWKKPRGQDLRRRRGRTVGRRKPPPRHVDRPDLRRRGRHRPALRGWRGDIATVADGPVTLGAHLVGRTGAAAQRTATCAVTARAPQPGPVAPGGCNAHAALSPAGRDPLWPSRGLDPGAGPRDRPARRSDGRQIACPVPSGRARPTSSGATETDLMIAWQV